MVPQILPGADDAESTVVLRLRHSLSPAKFNELKSWVKACALELLWLQEGNDLQALMAPVGRRSSVAAGATSSGGSVAPGGGGARPRRPSLTGHFTMPNMSTIRQTEQEIMKRQQSRGDQSEESRAVGGQPIGTSSRTIDHKPSVTARSAATPRKPMTEALVRYVRVVSGPPDGYESDGLDAEATKGAGGASMHFILRTRTKEQRQLVQDMAAQWHKSNYSTQWDLDKRAQNKSIRHLNFLFGVRVVDSLTDGLIAFFRLVATLYGKGHSELVARCLLLSSYSVLAVSAGVRAAVLVL